jgi:hypothetical protein
MSERLNRNPKEQNITYKVQFIEHHTQRDHKFHVQSIVWLCTIAYF